MSGDAYITSKQVKAMARELQNGFNVYLNQDTGEYYALPDIEQYSINGKFDTEAHRRITDHWDQYIIITCMESYELFEIMEEFMFEVDPEFHFKLLESMYRKNPLENFQYHVETSEYRDNWLSFFELKYIKYVEDNLISAGLHVEGLKKP